MKYHLNQSWCCFIIYFCITVLNATTHVLQYIFYYIINENLPPYTRTHMETSIKKQRDETETFTIKKYEYKRKTPPRIAASKQMDHQAQDNSTNMCHPH